MNVNIALLGAEGVGKSTLAALIFKAIDSAMPGCFTLPSPEDYVEINRLYDSLAKKEHAASSEIEAWNYQLSFMGDVVFNLQENPDSVKGIDVFAAVVDAQSLMKDKEAVLSDAAEEFFTALDSSKGSKILLVVPVNGDRYSNDDVLKKADSALAEPLETCRTTYRNRAGIAVLPVKMFDGAKFRPQGAEQVLRMAASFMLHEGVFKGELRDSALRLAGGAVPGNILCGHELFNAIPAKKPLPAGKIAAAAVIVLAVAGAGFFMAERKAGEGTAANSLLQARLDVAQRRITELNESLQAAIASRDEAINEVDTMRDEKEAAELRAEQAEQSEARYREQAKREIEGALQAEQDALKERDEAITNIKVLQMKSGQSDNSVKKLQQDNANLKVENENLKKQVQKLNDDLKKLEKKKFLGIF